MMPSTIPTTIEQPLRLQHRDSEFCWCEPLVEWDELDGKAVIIHREVTWN